MVGDWLVSWYAAQCDGDWEHQFGIRLQTLDNPGWALAVDVAETELEGRVLARSLVERTESDWIAVECDGLVFKAFGGTGNLPELLAAFRSFAEGAS